MKFKMFENVIIKHRLKCLMHTVQLPSKIGITQGQEGNRKKSLKNMLIKNTFPNTVMVMISFVLI